MIHLVEEELEGGMTAFQVFDREAVKKPDLELLKAFQKKNPKAKAYLLAPVLESWKYEGINIVSWEWMMD